MQTLKKGLVSNTWPREKTCSNCQAIISFEKEDLFKPEPGKIAFVCQECGRVQLIKDVLHIDDEKTLPTYDEFMASKNSTNLNAIEEKTSSPPISNPKNSSDNGDDDDDLHNLFGEDVQ